MKKRIEVRSQAEFDVCVKDGLLEEKDAMTLARDLSALPYRQDGFDLAKLLDDRWPCDVEWVEALDVFTHLVGRKVDQAQDEWAKKNNIQPPLPDGTRVRAKWGGEDVTGTIREVFEHGAAKYCVARDGDPKAGPPHHRAMIINFEDVTAES